MQQAGQAADLAMYAKGLALTRGHVWNDTGTNLVGIRNDVQSSKATLDNDMYLHIEGNELKNVFFGSTQPGQNSYDGSKSQGGVGQTFQGFYPMYGGFHKEKNSYVGYQIVQAYPGARDKNADGIHEGIEASLDMNRNPIAGAWIHAGGDKWNNSKVEAKNGKLVATLVQTPVYNWSQACSVINTSYFYDVSNDKAVTFLNDVIDKKQGKHGAFGQVEKILWANGKPKNLGYSLVSRNDFAAPALISALDSYRNNARRGYLDALIDKFITDNERDPKFKGKEIKKWPRQYVYPT